MLINQTQARAIINSTNGIIFGAKAIKADGSVRIMSARTGVKKGVTGNKPKMDCGISGREFSDLGFNHITVWDVNADCVNNSNKGGYRKINIGNLLSLKVKGVEYIVR